MKQKSIAVQYQNIQLPIKYIIYGFDRLSFYGDETNPNFDIETLRNHCREINVIPSKIKYQFIWTTLVELFQPDEECLNIIYKYIENSGCRVRFKYIEISADFIANSLREAKIIKNFLLAHIVFSKIRSKVQFFGKRKTYYFRPRSVSSKKCPVNFVLYHDRLSKLQNATPSEKCCHIELRLTGSNAMDEFGITSFKDILNFDFPTFFHTHIRLMRIKSKVSFARMIRDDPEVSNTALRNHANRVLINSQVGGQFVMQELIHQCPVIKDILKPISDSLFDQTGGRR